MPELKVNKFKPPTYLKTDSTIEPFNIQDNSSMSEIQIPCETEIGINTIALQEQSVTNIQPANSLYTIKDQERY